LFSGSRNKERSHEHPLKPLHFVTGWWKLSYFENIHITNIHSELNFESYYSLVEFKIE